MVCGFLSASGTGDQTKNNFAGEYCKLGLIPSKDRDTSLCPALLVNGDHCDVHVEQQRS